MQGPRHTSNELKLPSVGKLSLVRCRICRVAVPQKRHRRTFSSGGCNATYCCSPRGSSAGCPPISLSRKEEKTRWGTIGDKVERGWRGDPAQGFFYSSKANELLLYTDIFHSPAVVCPANQRPTILRVVYPRHALTLAIYEVAVTNARSI